MSIDAPGLLHSGSDTFVLIVILESYSTLTPIIEDEKLKIGKYFPAGNSLNASPKGFPSSEKLRDGFLVSSSNLSRQPIT